MEEDISPYWGHENLGRKKFGDLLLSCVMAESLFSDGAFVIALTAPFGSGKTHFLRAWESEIKKRRGEGDESVPRVITINAWDTDFSGEPLLAIIASVWRSLEDSSAARDQQLVDDLKTAGYGLLSAGAKIARDLAIGYVEQKTGVAVDSAVTSLAEGSPDDKLERKASQLLEHFETRQRSLSKFKLALKNLLKKEPSGLLLIVDELDRCKPTYAIEFLEAIKHVFDVSGLRVILSVDWEQLGAAAIALFGAGANTEEYLRKFIQRRTELPQLDRDQLNVLADEVFERFFSILDRRQPFGGGIRQTLLSLVAALDLSPRQMETTAFLLARLYYYKHLKEGQRLNLENRFHFVPEVFMACVHSKDAKLFDLLRRGWPLEDCIKGICDLQLNGRVKVYSPEFIEGRILAGLRTSKNDVIWKELMRKYRTIEIESLTTDQAHMFNLGNIPEEAGVLSAIAKRILEVSSIAGLSH